MYGKVQKGVKGCTIPILADTFSSDSQYLDTDRGQLGIGSLLPNLTPPPSESVKGSEIFVDWAWVVQKMKNVLLASF
jgi:hypothetical protein